MEALDASTCCVHWYASVRTKKIVATMDEVELRRVAGAAALCGSGDACAGR